MALIKCPECGKEVSDKSSICIGCGFPISEHFSEEIVDEVKESVDNDNGIKCLNCGSSNIEIMVEKIQVATKTSKEVKKKSVVTRAGNSLGRTGLIMATGGLWALTPKKSKYHEVGKEKPKFKDVKICVCQNCGYSWEIKKSKGLFF